jgi:hypothetical protein
MEHLDRLLAAAENPPFDRAARLHADLGGALDGPPTLTLSVTLVSGNGTHESPKKVLERVAVARRAELASRVEWLLRATGERRLLAPRIDEVYEAQPLGYEGDLRVLGAELDCRLDAAKALVSPQVLVEVAASLIPAERGFRGACFARARFQGVLLTPHIIEVKLFDCDLEREDDERWIVLKTWAHRSAGNNNCTVGA